jgi:tripartite-type tricarboxylate transporter receptor subunit TctC
LVRALAVTTAARLPAMPALPTVAEAGVPGYEMSAWYGIMAPAGTPRQIVDRLQREIAAAIHLPEVRARIEAEGAEPSGNTPEQFRDFAAAERRKWAEVVRDAKIAVD